jgi:hypothetical protein
MADGRGGEEELNHHSSMLPLNNSTETSPSPVLGAGAAAGGIPGRSTAGIDGGPELRSDQLKAQGRPSDSKEEVLKLLGRALVLPVVDGRYKTPVVTLHNSDTSNLYSLIERQLRGEYLVGAEKFWKVRRAGAEGLWAGWLKLRVLSQLSPTHPKLPRFSLVPSRPATFTG